MRMVVPEGEFRGTPPPDNRSHPTLFDVIPGQEQTAKKFTADWASYHVTPTKLIQGAGIFRGPQERADRPFLAAEVARNETRLFYKASVPELFPNHPPERTRNEMLFYRDIEPHLTALLPDTLRGSIGVPKLQDFHEGSPRRSILLDYIDGAETGSIHRSTPDALTAADIETVAVFIDTLTKTPLTQYKQWAPELDLVGANNNVSFEANAFGKYKYDLGANRREPIIREHLGEAMVASLPTILETHREILEPDPNRTPPDPLYLSRTISPGDLIKTDDRLHVIDWERIGQTNNPAYNYNAMLVSLWNQPELQAAYFRKVMELNPDPQFAKRLQLDFVFNRGTGEIEHWHKQPDSEEKTIALQTITRQTQDAINGTGLWAKQGALVGS